MQKVDINLWSIHRLEELCAITFDREGWEQVIEHTVHMLNLHSIYTDTSQLSQCYIYSFQWMLISFTFKVYS